MPINQVELLSAVRQLAEDENITVTVKESLKGGFIAGGGALMGGIIGGPVGIAFGGIMGSLYAAYASNGKFKSVALVIVEDMTPTQQTQLANSLRNVIEDLRAEDAIMLISLLATNPSIKQLVIKELSVFLKREMGLSITL